jgi:PEGA domain
MKGRQKAMVLGAFLGALGAQAAWADDDNRAVPRGGGSHAGSSAGASHHSSGGSSWDSSGSSSSSYGGDSSSYASAAAFADDNRAVPRGGGSSGGSSAGSSHHSSGGSSSGSSGSSYSGDSSSSGNRHHSRPPQTDAQRRKPTPGTGTGYRRHRGGDYYGSRYGYYPYSNYHWNYGYYWSPWYYPSYGGWYGGYGHYGYGPGYGGGYHRGYGNAGSVRVMVEPRQTKVYVDDYYAGVADDFDGIFQRLNLSTGRHDISLRLDGYETHRVKLYVPLDHTLKIKHEMVRGSSEKVSESTVGDPVDEARYSRDPDDDYENDRDHRDETRPGNRGERGTVRLDVTPSDASIYVDGVFRGTGQDLRRVTLPEGTHRLEVVRPGYRTLERDIDVTAGEVEEVDVDLPRS